MWGIDGKPSSISPGCVALYWFLNGDYARETNRQTIEISFTNNTDLSPEKELPVLIYNDGEKISGFVNIINCLAKNEKPSSDAATLLRNALLQFTNTELTVLTEYQLYLNKHNYETYTRYVFTQLLYWPMWYNTPMHYRAEARERCSGMLEYSTHEDDPDFVEPNITWPQEPSDLAQSKAFKVTQEKKKISKEELQNVKQNLVFLNKLSECLRMWIQIRERSLSEKIIPADLLMWANIYVQLQLPNADKISNHLAQALGSEIFNSLKSQLKVCCALDPLIPQREPTFQEQGNAVMAVFNGVRRYI